MVVSGSGVSGGQDEAKRGMVWRKCQSPLVPRQMLIRIIEVLTFPAVQLLDVTGPVQVFASANDLVAKRRRRARLIGSGSWRKAPKAASPPRRRGLAAGPLEPTR